MSKEELKKQYKLNEITSKEYFLKLCRIIRSESFPIVLIPPVKVDPTTIFDGKLPL